MAQILGILNITADSFSDGGRHLDPEAAIAHAEDLAAAGADMIDLGPASSHPDAQPVSPEVEIARLEKVLPALLGAGLTVSVDSFHPATQLYALYEGAQLLNDIHGFPNPEIYDQLASSSAQLIVMHAIQGQGIATRADSDPDTIFDEVCRFFDRRVGVLEAAGIARERLILDPGMGFFVGNRPEASFRILTRLGELKARFGLPVLVSVSRKSFLRKVTGRSLADIGPASLAAELLAAREGADYLRTHEPARLKDALAIARAFDENRP